MVLALSMSVAQANVAAASFARASLLAYAVGQWPGYQVAPHHKLLGAKLEAVERGEIKRLIVTMPPRHGKSMAISEFFPAWSMGRKPDRQIIAASYGQDLANDFGRRVRDLSTSPLHLAAFPGSELTEDSKAAHRFHTNARGVYYAIGRGGAGTGRGADLLLLDDTLKDRQEAESETIREQLKGWYRTVARTRLMPGGAIVIVQTRWHDDDLVGYVLREHSHEGWTVLNLPAIAEADDPLGRAEGEALWPDRFQLSELESLKITLGSYDFGSLYQGRPVPIEGSIFKLAWFANRYATAPRVPIRIVQSWDTGLKESEANSYSVCTTWAETETDYYLLHVLRKRMEWPELRRTAESLGMQFHPSAVLIEDKASGISLVQDLRANTKLPVIAVEPEGDKVIRAKAVSPLAEAGRVRLPVAAEWLVDYEHEVTRFPSAATKDQMDSTSQALRWMASSALQPVTVSRVELARRVDPIMGMQT